MSQAPRPLPLASTADTPGLAQRVIDKAVEENLWREYICYGLVIASFLVGTVVIGCGVYYGLFWIAVSGGVPAVWFWPALKHAMEIRRENMAIRLMEVPLSQAKTAEEASKAINDAFVTHFGKGKGDVVSKA